MDNYYFFQSLKKSIFESKLYKTQSLFHRNHMENHKNCLQDTLEILVTSKVQTKISLRLNFWTNLLLLTRMKLMTSLDELLWFMLEKMIWAWEVKKIYVLCLCNFSFSIPTISNVMKSFCLNIF